MKLTPLDMNDDKNDARRINARDKTEWIAHEETDRQTDGREVAVTWATLFRWQTRLSVRNSWTVSCVDEWWRLVNIVSRSGMVSSTSWWLSTSSIINTKSMLRSKDQGQTDTQIKDSYLLTHTYLLPRQPINSFTADPVKALHFTILV